MDADFQRHAPSTVEPHPKRYVSARSNEKGNLPITSVLNDLRGDRQLGGWKCRSGRLIAMSNLGSSAERGTWTAPRANGSCENDLVITLILFDGLDSVIFPLRMGFLAPIKT